MPKRIESITLDNFKGATCETTIDIDANKPVVMIFGENGTGKSTIIDGIDFVCNEEFGSINERSVSSSKADLVAALGSNFDKLKITLKYGGNIFTGTIGHGKKPYCSGVGNKPRVFILRRSQILTIVNGDPRVRYDALKSFIAVPNTENNEKTLRDAIRTIQDYYNEAARATQQAHEQLEALWKAEGSPDSAYQEWGKIKSAVNVSAIKESLLHLDTVISKMTSCAAGVISIEKAEAVLLQARGTFDEAEKAFKAVQTSMEGHEKDVINILNDAKEFLEKYPNIESCPVCEGTVKTKQLVSRIDTRLGALSKLIKLKSSYDSAQKDLNIKEQLLIARKKEFIGIIKELLSIVKLSKTPEIVSLNISWAEYNDLIAIENSADALLLVPKASAIYQKLLTSKSGIELRKEKEQKELNQLNAIRTNHNAIGDKTRLAKGYEKQLATLQQMHEIIETARKTYVEDELNNISDEVAELYSKIHPKEGLGKVKFFLKPKTIGSLEFTGEFQGIADIQPQAYYSESHLDTLGVCVFLALAKKYSDVDNTVVVLDDVITSVDQTHMTRLINMFHDEADKFNQLIITTHYRPWKDKYKYYGGPTVNINLVELLHWSHPRGIRHTRAKLSVEELEEYLQDGKYDRQVVASKAGILLEGLTDHIALRYNCRLPRKAEVDYTLGELLHSIDNKLRKTLNIVKVMDNGTTSTTPAESYLDEIKALSWIRNEVGCHFKISDSTSDSEVINFGRLTVSFAKVLICDKCGELPYRDKSGSYWECRCSSTQMHPHKIPG